MFDPPTNSFHLLWPRFLLCYLFDCFSIECKQKVLFEASKAASSGCPTMVSVPVHVVNMVAWRESPASFFCPAFCSVVWLIVCLTGCEQFVSFEMFKAACLGSLRRCSTRSHRVCHVSQQLLQQLPWLVSRQSNATIQCGMCELVARDTSCLLKQCSATLIQLHPFCCDTICVVGDFG